MVQSRKHSCNCKSGVPRLLTRARNDRERSKASQGEQDRLHTVHSEHSHPPSSGCIDAGAHPHIIDAIFDTAPRASLFALRGACKAWQLRAHRQLVEHIVFEHNFVSSRDTIYSSLSVQGRPRALPFTTDNFNHLAPYVRFVDFQPGVHVDWIPDWVSSLPNVKIVRDCKSTAHMHVAEMVDMPECDVFVTLPPIPVFAQQRVPVREDGRLVFLFPFPDDQKLYFDDWLAHLAPNDAKRAFDVVLVFHPPRPCPESEASPFSIVLNAARDLGAASTFVPGDDDQNGLRFFLVNYQNWVMYDGTYESSNLHAAQGEAVWHGRDLEIAPGVFARRPCDHRPAHMKQRDWYELAIEDTIREAIRSASFDEWAGDAGEDDRVERFQQIEDFPHLLSWFPSLGDYCSTSERAHMYELQTGLPFKEFCIKNKYQSLCAECIAFFEEHTERHFPQDTTCGCEGCSEEIVIDD